MVTPIEGIKVGVGREQPRISKGTFIIGTCIFYITILFMYSYVIKTINKINMFPLEESCIFIGRINKKNKL